MFTQKLIVFISLITFPLCALAQHHHMQNTATNTAQESMTQDASGTSWQPASTPMQGLMWNYAAWNFMLQGDAFGVYDHQGGPRGQVQSFSESMLMFMGQRSLGAGTLGFHTMFSLDPLTMENDGYPLLFQTGETADGQTPLVDRQHPHNALMELAGSYSLPLNKNNSIYFYAGLPGEPALGPPVFMSRFSGMDNPEAPLSHHWLDSTHTTFGVVTLGYVWHDVKIETSAFNGREPNQDRWAMHEPHLNSDSVRLSYNPTANWALQISRGYINSPEQLTPNVNVWRTTASAMYNKPFADNDNWQTSVMWGENQNDPGHTLNAYLLESAVDLYQTHTFFMRAERVQEDELFEDDENIPQEASLIGQVFSINKLTLGYIYDFFHTKHMAWGVGALGSAYAYPNSLNNAYGTNPFSYMVFTRVKLI